MGLIHVLPAILPPPGVFLQAGVGQGGVGDRFWLNIPMTIPGYIPGTVRAI
jgi:uncharacterized membrane protein YqaE (UPF0057 family)